MTENPFDAARRQLDEAERHYAAQAERSQREFSAGMAQARAQLDEAEQVVKRAQGE